MTNSPCTVSLVTDLDAVMSDLIDEPVWMVCPQFEASKHTNYRMRQMVQLVGLESINLSQVKTFEAR